MTTSRPASRASVAVPRADVALLAAVPAVLLFFHFGLPPALRHRLVFDHSAPSLLTMWTSSYIHRTNVHLYGNLIAYVGVILPTYFVFAYEGRRRVFRWLFLTSLLAVPFALAAANYAFYQWVLHLPHAANRGFSGIVGALSGVLFASLIGLVYRETGEWGRAAATGAVLILSGLGAIAFVGGILTLTLGGAVVVGLGLSLSALVPQAIVCDPSRMRAFVDEHHEPLVLGLYGAAVIVTTLPGLFPVDWVGTNSVTNVFAHLVGFLFGTVAPAVRIIVTGRWTTEPHSK